MKKLITLIPFLVQILIFPLVAHGTFNDVPKDRQPRTYSVLGECQSEVNRLPPTIGTSDNDDVWRRLRDLEVNGPFSFSDKCSAALKSYGHLFHPDFDPAGSRPMEP